MFKKKATRKLDDVYDTYTQPTATLLQRKEHTATHAHTHTRKLGHMYRYNIAIKEKPICTFSIFIGIL